MTTAPTATPMPDAQPAPADPRFDTAHLRKDLRGRSVRGGVVTLVSQGLKFVITTGSTAVLARILTPGDFGLIAMVAAVVGFAALFKDLGLSMATVQRERVGHAQVSAMFWVNVAVSTLIALLVAACSPLVAMLYREPRLVPVTIALGSTFILGGLAAQHTALLRRQMRFTALASIEVVSLAVGAAVAIAVAWPTRSYWALVAMTATQAFVAAAMAWALSGWTPGRPRWDADARGMLAFGGYLTGFNLLNYFTRNFDNVLIGAALGAGPLGLYSRAYNLLMLPIRQVNGPATAVAMPALSRLQSDPPAYRRFFLRAVSMMSLITAPIVAYSFADADLLVLLLLGEQWTGAVDIFRLLAPAAFVGAINIVPGWLCSSLGTTKKQFVWAAWSMPVVVAGFAVGLLWGTEGVAASFSVTFSFTLLAFIRSACKDSPVSTLDLWRAFWRTFLAAVAAAGVVLALKAFTPTGDLPLVPQILLNACVYGAAFLLAMLATPGGARELRLALELRRDAKGIR